MEEGRMSISEWHLDAEAARLYASGESTGAFASSVELHLVVCSRCRAMVAPGAEAARLQTVWTKVVEEVMAPQAGPLERLLRRIGVTEPTARLIAVTPSLRAGWLSAIATLLAVSLLIAHVGDQGIAVFFIVAPLLPMVGVAVAFAPPADAMHDMISASPYDNFRLLAVRAVAVVTATVGIVLLAGVLLPDARWLGVGGLLRALALSVLPLAAAPRIPPLYTAAALGAGWLAVTVPALRPQADPLLATHLP